MRKGTVFGFFLFLLLGFACESSTSDSAHSPVEKVNAPEQDSSNPLSIDLRDLPTGIPSDTVSIRIAYDHSLKQAKVYQAIPFLPLLRQLIAAYNIDSVNTEVQLVCKDGYIPSLTLPAILKQGGGYLAFRDEEAEEGTFWDKEIADQYSPFYLVWENLPYEDHSMAWPFGLVSLSFVSLDQSLNTIRPMGASHQVQEGFELYKENCLKCHAINQIGGIMGPEFNQPRNITEYWKVSDIIAFAKHPQSYRLNSKMPAITHLTESELVLITDYLQFLALQSE